MLGFIILSANASAAILRVAAGASDASPDGSTWAKAYPSLQAALTAAPAGTEIWIKTGIYKPTTGTDRTATFRLKSQMVIRGGFRGDETDQSQRQPWGNPVVLSGDIGTPMVGAITEISQFPSLSASTDDAGWQDNSYNVLVGDGVEDVILEYLTVTGGSATDASIAGIDMEGYEMYSANPDTPGAKSTVKPSSTVVGGGLYFTTGPSWTVSKYGVQLQGCRFVRNRARGYGGGMGVYDACVFIDGCQFEENVSDGSAGAFWGSNQQSGFIHTDFTDNTSQKGGGAVSIKSVPSFRSSDGTTIDKIFNGIQSVAFLAAGAQQAVDETKEDAKNRISKALTDYGIYKASAGTSVFSLDGAGLFSSVAGELDLPISKNDVKLALKVVNKARDIKDKVVEIKNLGGITSLKSRPTNIYAIVKLSVEVGDLVANILDSYGLVDHSNPHYQNWKTFSVNFNKYATPEGLIKLWLEDRMSRIDTVTPAMMALKKNALKNYYTQAGRSGFAGCKFSGNETESLGGAIELVFNNLLVESCTFTDNRAVTDGAAISSSIFCMPQVISSLFSNNFSDQGTSAISNTNSSLMLVANCTIINNKSFDKEGVALSAMMGADVRVYNSILWNNASATKSKGADVFASTRDAMDPDTQVKFDALQNGQQANWVGIMEIRNSIIQSLKTIPLGEDKLSLSLGGNAWMMSQIELDEMIAAAIAGRNEADARGELESIAAVNAGSGVRPKLRDASYGNSDADPLLLAKPLGKPSRRSPVYNAGDDRWSTGRLIEHATLVENILDVADSKRIANSKVDIGAYEIDPSKPDEYTQLAGQAAGADSDAPVATGIGAGTPPFVSPVSGGTVYRVKPGATGSGASWNDAADLKTAISHANAEVWVAAGTYKPGTTRDASFAMADGVKIFGGFAGTVSESSRSARDWKTNVTIISGDIGAAGVSTDNSKNLFKNSGVTSSAVLDGFTLRDAYSLDADGGAVSNDNSNPILQNCLFQNNHARNGGAIYSSGSSATGSTLVNCEFRENSADQAGGAIRYTHTLFGHRLIFSGNTASTGGGALSVTGTGTTQYCTIQNGLFYGNSSTSAAGGAIASRGLYLNVQNSTFYGNTSTISSTLKSGGGAIDHAFTTASRTASAVVLNSIFYKNTATNGASGGVATMEKRQIQTPDPLLLSHSLVQGLNTYAGGEGEGNFDGDPQFVAEGTNFHLQPQSLAIDAGDGADVYTESLSVDLEGNARSFNSAIDLGPYERTTVTPVHPVTGVTQVTVPAAEGEAGIESHVFSSSYTLKLGDAVRWYVDRGDGLGFVPLEEDSAENVGVRTDTLTVLSPPNGFSYRLQVTHNDVVYTSPISRLLPSADSINRYVFVKPSATGDGTGTSWPDATTLQSALTNAPPGAEIWVAEGTYKPTTGTDRDAHFASGKSRKIYGGFVVNQMVFSKRDWRAHKTTISGEIGSADAADNSRNLLTNTNVGNTSILDGFYFKGAYGDGVDGGAIRNISSSLTIQNCVFESNHARNGGAISSTEVPSEKYGPTLAFCEFWGNSSELAGGAVYYNGFLNTRNLLFRNNTAQTGGAVYVTGDFDGQAATFENSLFAGNQSSGGLGGAVTAAGIGLYANNCTFHGNQATINSPGKASGGAIYFDDPAASGQLVSNNSIFYKNTALNSGAGGHNSIEKQQIFVNGGNGVFVRHSLVQGLDTYTAGSNNTNIDADPLFVAEGTNFRLSDSSLAIDAGADPNNPNFEMTDLDGGERIRDEAIDLGAYEHAPLAVVNPLRTVVASSSGRESYNYTAQYTVQPGDVARWYVDRGDGNGFVVLGERDPGNEQLPQEYFGVSSPSLGILSPPSGYRFQLRLTRNGTTFYSPVKQLRPTELSKAAYVYVRPVATGDGSGSGWINATSDLQEAMSRTNAEVWVQEGTYLPTTGTDRDKSFSLTTYGVKVYAGFKGGESLRDARKPVLNVTKISGAIGGPERTDNSRHLFKNVVDVGGYTVLDGFTFEDAYADGEDGGAIHNTGTSPAFHNCVFQNNHARNGGAIFSTGTTVTGSALLNCKFKNNTADVNGGAISSTTAHNFINVVFESNQAGTGGAISVDEGSPGQVFNVKNGLFFNNRALNGNGGAIYSKGFSVYSYNTTFYGNQSRLSSASKLGGGAIYVNGGTSNATASNSIFYQNSSVNSGAGGLESLEAQQISVKGGNIFANHSLIHGLNELAYNKFDANFDVDPEFVNPAGGNFRLSNFSEAINSGTGAVGYTSISLYETDLDGMARIQGGAVDLGPYENTTAAALGRVTSSTDFSGGIATFLKNANVVVQSGDLLRWYVLRNGVWVLLSADAVYSGVNSATLTIKSPPSTDDGLKFRLQITRGGETLTSLPTQLTLPLERIYVNAARAGMAADGAGWSTAYGDLQDALKASGPGSSIWVARGTYYPTTGSNTALSFRIPAGVSLYGGFVPNVGDVANRHLAENPTILSGKLTGATKQSGYSRNVVRNQEGQGRTAVLDGFVIQDSFSSLVLNDGTSPTIRNCVFQDSVRTASDGSALAISNINGADPLIAECKFLRNSTTSGGVVSISGASATIENSLFAQNNASYTGIILVKNGILDMVHCTVVDNTTLGNVAGLDATDSTVTVSNSIFWNNQAGSSSTPAFDKAIRTQGGTATFQSSCIQGGTSLPAGNISTDPLFTEPTATVEYALAPYSPLVNAGSVDHTVSSGVDLERNPRVFFTKPDMGAYELQRNIVAPVLLTSLPRSRTVYGVGGSVDFRVTWPSATAFTPVWEVWKVVNNVKTLISPSRYTIIGGESGLSTLRLNNISLGDSGVKVTVKAFYYDDVLGENTTMYTPPATLTVRMPRLVHVDSTATGSNNGTSWDNAYTDLAMALENSQTADEIWVAKGTYTAGSLVYFELKPTVSVYGGFSGNEVLRSGRNIGANLTILHAMGSNPVVYGAAPESEFGLPSVMDGFIVENGVGPILINNSDSSTTYRNFIFRNNTAPLINSRSQVTYDQCEFTGHTGMLFSIDRSTVAISGGDIHDNTSTNDLILSSDTSTVTLSDVKASGNTVAGALLRNGGGSGASLTVLRSAFEDNSTGGAVIANAVAGTAVIESSLFAQNTATGDLATVQNMGTLSISLSTVADNRGGSAGGGVFTSRTGVSAISTSILWGNRGTRSSSTLEKQQLGDSTGTDGAGVLTVGRSTIEGLVTFTAAGDFNTGYYPFFVDPSEGDYHLVSYSPAIDDAASNQTLLSPSDLGKVTRRNVYGAAGAYEFSGTLGTPILISTYPSSIATTETAAAGFTYVGQGSKQWQYFDGTNWVNITVGTSDYQVINDGSSSTLHFGSPSLGLNGTRYRLVVSLTSGGVTTTHTTEDLVLTVNRPRVIYVDGGKSSSGNGSSWTMAFKTVQEALATTNANCEIWVRAGSYAINNASLGWNVHLYGGFAGTETARTNRNVSANEVTLLGSGKQIFVSNDSTAARRDKTTDAVLDGFTLSGATAKTAIFLNNSQSTIRNCTFRENGSAIGVAGLSNPLISDCVFDSHTSTVLSLDGDSATVSGCSFVNNRDSSGSASGSTVYVYRGAVKISDSTFSGNTSSGGIVVLYGEFDATSPGNVVAGKVTQLTMSRCEMIGNTAYAAILATQSLLNLDNSVIARNAVYNATIKGFSQCQFNLTNVTIAHNDGSLENVALANDGRTNLRNSILWGNRTSWPYAALIHPGSLSLMEDSQIKRNQWTVISNSIIEGAYAISGNGNSGYDPLFVNVDALDYEIPAFSPAVNAGSATGIPVGTLDLASQPRVHGSAPDIGAYEFIGTAASPIQMSTNHGARTVVVGQEIQYYVQAPAGVNVQWQVKSGESFVNVVSGGNLVVSGNGGTMTLSNVQFSLTGTQFRFVLSGNASYISPAGLLTVASKQLIFVNASATGSNNGSSWANAFTSLTDAISSANHPLTGGPREIWVAQGTYGTDSSISPGVDLYGGFEGIEGVRSERNVKLYPTILTPVYVNGSDMLSNGGYTDTKKIGNVIDGFTLTGTTGGISVYSSPMLVKNCTFSALSDRALINVTGPLTVEDCIFDQSGGLAVVSGPSSTTTIRRSIFQGGKDVSVQSSAEGVVTVEDCLFQDNNPTDPTDPVVYPSIGSTINIVRSKFLRNHNNSVVNNDGRIFIRQSLFADNFGAGVDTTFRAEATQLTSCTVVNNASWGIGIGWQNSSLRLTNCIIAGNGFRQQIYTDSGGVFASYTLVQGETHGGNGNMSWDPLFTNAGAGDYTLSARSPAVNAGNAGPVNVGETDLTGGTRITSGGLDLGAYESAHAPDPLYRSALPTSLATIRGVDGVFSITGDPSYTYTWQYKNGSEWVTISYNSVTGQWEGPNGVPVIITTVNGVSKLTFPGPALSTNGIKVRVTINGQGVTSGELTLTVTEPETMYVDASVTASGNGKTWGTAFKTLDEALWENPTRLNQSRRIIRIAKGTYTAPSNGFDIRQRLEIYGGYPNGGGSREVTENRVILSGERGDPASTADNSTQVLLVNAISLPIGADTIFDGFSVVDGKEGIDVVSNARPTLRNLIISHNTEGGLSITSAGGRVENCQFLENSAYSGAGASVNGSTATFSNCTFRGNVASSSGAGLYILNSVVRMENLVISGNRASVSGGGIEIDGGSSNVLLNSTIVGNYAGEGGGLYAYIGAGASIRNSIVWGNRASGGTLEVQQFTNHLFGGGFSLQSSNVEGRAAGGGNLGVAPLFYGEINAADAPTIAGDFRLQGGSPGVDAGDNSLLEGLALDADNAPRVVRTVDLGAYEFQGSQSDPLIITQQPADLVLPVQSAPRQFQVVLTGSNYIFQWESSPNGITYTPVVDGPGYSGAQTATLQLLSDDPTKHGYFFRVKVNGTNGGAITSRSALLSVYPPRYYVNAAAADDSGDGYTWATAFKTVGTAFTKVRLNPTTGVQIWVAGGTYRPSETDPALSFPLRANVELYGGFGGSETDLGERDFVTHPTILQGIAGSSAIFASANTTTVTGMRIDGFTLNTAVNGISMGKNVTLAVANCSFEGLGTGIKSDADAPTIQHSILVRNCRFTGLTQAGISTVWSSVNVADSVFTANRQGMVMAQGNSYIGRSEFRGNGAADVRGGALKTVVVATLIENCLFSGNFAQYGGGIYSEGGDNVVFRNSTIAGNYGLTSIGGLYFARSQNTGRVEIYNSIIWGNATNGPSQYTQYLIDANVSGGVSTSNNDVQDAVAYLDFKPANGNLTIDPGFAAPVAASVTGTTAGDYRLLSQSGLLNRGSNSLVGGSATDLAGAPRIFETTVDMGAYEFSLVPIRLTTQPVNANAGDGIPGVFSVVSNSSEAAYQWQVSLNGTWTDLVESSTESGVQTATLTVTGGPSYHGRLYRVHVTTPTAGELYSNVATYIYVYATAGPEANIANQMLTGPISKVSFVVDGGILPASILDGSFAVHGAQTGRLTLADGSLTGYSIAGNTVSLQTAVPFKAGEQVQVSATGGLKRLDGYSAFPATYQFRAGSQGRYGIFTTPGAIAGASSATALASGDVNGNGSVDLVIGGSNGAGVWLNNGAGAFISAGQTLGSGAVSQVLVGSLGITRSSGSRNKLDVVLRKAGGDVEIWRNEGDGAFSKTSTIAGLSATSLGLADLNGDGALDLFIATSAADQVWFNNGDGTFTDSAQRLGNGAGLSVAFGDHENDNRLDVFTANGDAPMEIWSNDGTGRFSAGATPNGGEVSKVIAVDFDKDGRLDIIGVRNTGVIRIFRQASNYTRAYNYTNQTVPVGLPVADSSSLNVADLDNDGFADLVFPYQSDNNNIQVWRGTGFDGSFARFQKITEQPAFAMSKALDLADLNGDGMMDSVFISASGVPMVSYYVGTPTAPTGLVATADSDTRVSLAWTDTATGETNYSVERSPNGSTNWIVISSTLPANSTSYVDTGRSPSTPYFYRVRSNVAGTLQSAYSATADTKTPDAVNAASDAIAMLENGTATTLVSGAASVLANDSTPAELTAVVVTAPAHGTLTFSADGTFSYSPAAGYSGADSFTYRATNGLTHASAVGTVSITVTRLNEAPATLTLTPAGGTLYTGQTAGLTVATLSATDPDPEDNGLLTFSLVAGDGSAGNADFSFTGASLKTANVINAASGLTRSVRIRVTDTLGLFREGIHTITFTQAPTAGPATFVTDEDNSVAVLLPGAGGAAPLGYTIVSQPSHGSLAPGANGSAHTYTPAANFNGSDSFTYRVTDSVLTSATATVTINVTPVNDPPALAAVAPITTIENTPVSFTLVGSDVDGDAMTTYQLTSTPTLGSVQMNDAVVTYTPFTNILGTETLAFTVTAGGQTSAPLQVIVAITGEPVTSLVYRGLSETTTIPSASGDWSNPTIAITNLPSHGTVVNTGTDFLYTHNGDSATGDSYTYTATNAGGEIRTITVTITVSDHVILVNSTDDDTLNASDDAGHNTLAEALATVDRFWNTKLASTDATADWTIRIATRPAAYVASTTGYEGSFAEGYRSAFRVRGKVTIEAPATTGVDVFVLNVTGGANRPRNFLVTEGARLTLKNLTLRSGQGTAINSAGAPAGSGVSRGGGIYNFGTFTAENVLFETLTAHTGAAIYNDGGSVSLTACDFAVNNSFVFDGSDGGVIWSRNGSLTLNDVYLDNDENPELFVVGDGSVATVNVSNSRIGSASLIKRNGGSLVITGLPLAVDDTVSYPVGAPLTFNIDTLLANDFGTPLKNITVSPLSAKGIPIIRDGNNLTYNADAALDGDSFTYAITMATDQRISYSENTTDLTSTATVTVDFNQLAGFPVGVADSGTAYRGLSTDISVLANDTDPTGDPLAIASFSQPAQGTVTKVGSVLRYTHDNSMKADPEDATPETDSFTYSVSNSTGITENVRVEITIHERVVIAHSGEQSGPGTLRDAINFINGFTSGGNPSRPWTVRIATGANDRWYVSSGTDYGDPLYRSAFEIRGNITIDAGDSENFELGTFLEWNSPTSLRLFLVNDNASLTLKNIKLAGMRGGNFFNRLVGGAVLNFGTFTAENVEFQYFEAQLGAAIFNDGGDVVLTDCDFYGNSVRYAGWDNLGVVVSHNGDLTLDGVTFADGMDPELYVYGDGTDGAIVRFLTPPDYSRILSGKVTTPGLPLAKDDFAETRAGTTLNIPISTLLSNDGDTANTTLSISGSSSGVGSVAISGNSITYSSPDWFEGQDSFTYTLTTASGYSSTATVRIDVTPIPPAPKIAVYNQNYNHVGDGATMDFGVVQSGTSQGNSYIVTVMNHGNDYGNSLNVGLSLEGDHSGDYEINEFWDPMNPNGYWYPWLYPNDMSSFQVTFRPSGPGARTNILHLRSNDPETPDFKLTLTGFVNTVPTFDGYAANVPHNTSVPLSLAKILAKAHDEDGDTLSFTNDGTTANGGTLTRTASALSYTPPNGFSGQDSFSITIRDTHGSNITGTVILNVAEAVTENPLATNPNPPKLTVVNGDIKLSFQGLPNRAYDIERSVNMGTWEVIATRTASNIGKIEFTDTDPPPGSGFYRIKKH